RAQRTGRRAVELPGAELAVRHAPLFELEPPFVVGLPRTLERTGNRKRDLGAVARDGRGQPMRGRISRAREIPPLDHVPDPSCAAYLEHDIRLGSALRVDVRVEPQRLYARFADRDLAAGRGGGDDRPPDRPARTSGRREPPRQSRPEVLEVRAVEIPLDIELATDAASRRRARCAAHDAQTIDDGGGRTVVGAARIELDRATAQRSVDAKPIEVGADVVIDDDGRRTEARVDLPAPLRKEHARIESRS